MRKDDVRRQVAEALAACEDKKAENAAILELEKDSGAFTDYFLICSGSNPRQIQAISDEVEERLSRSGLHPAHVEGYNQADWVLLDYIDFVVHVFSSKARDFYNLERLWKSAKHLSPAELKSPAKKKTASRRTATPAKKKSPRRAAR
ncbi:MAG TPA: ribosome silencing factor [Terriglobales bacterium]|nr:ribosome silencing factor [Terriglobales bacterium]